MYLDSKYFVNITNKLPGTLYLVEWCASLASIVRSLVANYRIAVSYPQQGHIDINVDYSSVIIISVPVMLFLHFIVQRFK